MTVQTDDSARGASQPPIDVPALLGRFREGYGIGQLSAWCGHGQGAIEDVLREALRGQAWQPIETAPQDGRTFHAYGPTLVHPDFNPWGCVEAVYDGERFIGAVWDGTFDQWNTVEIVFTHWREMPAPPAARETGAP